MMVPEMLRDSRNRPAYVSALREADEAFAAGMSDYLRPVVELLNKPLHEQLKAEMDGLHEPQEQKA